MTGGAEDQDRKDSTKGFAGLSSLVSDVDASSVAAGGPSTARPSSSGARPATAAPVPVPAQPRSQPQVQPQAKPQAQTTYQAPEQPTGISAGAKWLLGISVVFGLIWLVSLLDKESSGTSPSYSSATTSSAATTSPPVWQQPAAPAPAPSRPTEETPPVGSGSVLTAPQIRYCTAESIRLDAANEAINQYNDSDVDRFNTLVADYNSRCSNFRYREGALEIARSEVERFRSDYVAQGRQRFATSNDLPSVSPEVRSVPPPTLPRPEARVPTHDTAALQVSGPEEESVEAACSSDKYLNGPAAYSSCRERQIAQLRNGPRRPDLSGLASAERESIEVACSSDKYLNGPAAYNRCLTTQLRALGSNNRRPSLDSLSSSERESIEAACSSDKYLNGPAAYNQCLSSQLATLGRQARRPNLSNLSDSQRQSIEAACSSDKYLNGPAAYNDCLTRQLQQLR
jgi:hypothetical protein